MDLKEIYWGRELDVLLPLEKRQIIAQKKQSLVIGVAKEDGENEMRVSVTPQLAATLIDFGFTIKVQKDAGKYAHFSNEDYAGIGAKICESSDEIFACDIIFKIVPPTFSELVLMKEKSCLFSSLDICKQPKEYYEKLIRKKITAISYEFIKDTTGCYPLLRVISEIAGQRLPFIASQCLSNEKYGKRIMLSNVVGVLPAKVVLIGAGTVVSNAARYFVHLGCEMKIFDTSMRCLRRLEEFVGYPVHTSILQTAKLRESIKNADVVIFAKHAKEGTSEWIITEEMVKQMSAGSVVIDVSIDQGGGVETSVPTTLKKPVFVKYGVIHYCVPNIASSVPRTSSEVISNFLHGFFEKPFQNIDIKTLLLLYQELRNGTYVYQGILTNQLVSFHSGISGQDINLLLNTPLG